MTLLNEVIKDNPSIAILIPSYNHARFLPSLFQSILDQTYTNLQVIFSDDASTDNSREVADKWFPKLYEKFHDVKFIYHSKNFGDKAWSNIRLLAEEVKDADYIHYCESDDYFKPTKLEKQVQYLKTHPEFSACHTEVETIDESGLTCPAFWRTNRASQTGGDPTIPVGDIRKHLEICNFIYTCSMLTRTDLLKKHFQFERFQNELETGFGDYPFFLSLSREALIGYIDEPLSVYRILSNSLSHQDRPWIVEKTERIKTLARKGII